MSKEYLGNPKQYWFKRKTWGWGWTPSTWQGWLIIFLYAVLVLLLLLTKEKDIQGDHNSGSNFLVLGLSIIFLTFILIFIAYKKGEKPRWQ